MDNNNMVDQVLDNFIEYLEDVLITNQYYGYDTAEKCKKFLLLLSLPKSMVYSYLAIQLNNFVDGHLEEFINEFCIKLDIKVDDITLEHREQILKFISFFSEVLC